MGTFFLSLFMELSLNSLNSIDSQSNFSFYSLMAATLVMWFFGGFFFGLFPAIGTAGVIIAKEMVIKNFWSYIQIFAIGFCITMLFYKKIPYISGLGYSFEYYKDVLRKVAFNSCGGFSAVICGFLSLPRQNKEM